MLLLGLHLPAACCCCCIRACWTGLGALAFRASFWLSTGSVLQDIFKVVGDKMAAAAEAEQRRQQQQQAAVDAA